jgi:predicted nucleotidyltransferase
VQTVAHELPTTVTPDRGDLPAVLDKALRTLDRARIDHVVIGGIASSVLGRPRTTTDIDVFLKPADALPALDALGAAGFDTDRLDDQWIYKATLRDICVDIIFSTRYGIYLDDRMFERSRIEQFESVSVRVIAPEDLFVIKAIAHDEATPRHWFDALGVLIRSKIDWDYMLERSSRANRRVLSLLLYAQSVDYFVPQNVVTTLSMRVCAG